MGKEKPEKEERRADSGAAIGAGLLGLSAFVVACVAGLAVGVEPATVLVRAIGCLLGAALVGGFLGRAGTALVAEAVEQHKQAVPIPDRPAELEEGGDAPAAESAPSATEPEAGRAAA